MLSTVDIGQQRAALGRLSSLLIAILLSAAVIAPQLYVYLTGAHPLAIANESLAYRYFFSYRIWMGLSHTPFLPQGQLLDAFAYVTQCVLALGVDPAKDLWLSTFLFGWAVFAANFGVICGALFLVLPDPGRKIAPFVGVLAFVLLGYYASRSGLNLLLAPDYYLFEVSLTALSLAVGFRLLQAPPGGSPVLQGLKLGALAGAMLTIKITLVGAIVFPLAASLIGREPRTWISLAVGMGVGAMAVALATVLIALGFNIAALPRYMMGWVSFVGNPGGEPGFYYSLFAPWSLRANAGASYQYAIPLLIAFVAAAVYAAKESLAGVGHRLDTALLVGLPLLLTGAHLVGLVHRPAGTTLWETGLFLTASTIWFVVAPDQREKEWAPGPDLRLAVIGLLSATLVIALPVNLYRIVHPAAFRTSSQAVWDAHALSTQGSGGGVVLVPDNNHTAGTVGEALLKGATDFPTWNITVGTEMLIRLVPGLEIRSTLDAAAPDKSLTWVDIAEGPPLTERFPILAKRKQEGACRSFPIENWPWWRRIITVCPAIAPKE